jgi:hypothetical protein
VDQKALEKYKALAAQKQGKPLENAMILLLGAMSSGKTTLGFTASEQCPDKLPAEKLTDLEDIAYIPVEAGGEDSLRGLKLRVPPKHVVPFAEMLGDIKHPVQATCTAVDFAKSLGVNKLFMDSGSKFDGLLQGWLNTDEGKLQWGGDKFAMFRYSLASHQVLNLKVQEFTGLKIVSFHPQAVIEDLDSKGQEKSASAQAMDQKMARQDKANGTIAQADLILGVTGKARDLWPKDASLILGLQQVKKDGKYVRQVLTQFDEKSGLAVKSRFEGILDPIEEGHLGKIIRKIRAFS